MRSGVRSPLSPPSRLDENQGGFFHTFCGQEGLRPTKDRKAPDGVARPALSLRIFNEILSFDTVFKNRQTLSLGKAPLKVSPICAESADAVSYRLRRAVKSWLCLLSTEARHEIRALRALAARSLYARLIKPDAPRAMDALNVLFRLPYHFARRKRLRSVVKLL